jgi:hypothetical protein
MDIIMSVIALLLAAFVAYKLVGETIHSFAEYHYVMGSMYAVCTVSLTGVLAFTAVSMLLFGVT